MRTTILTLALAVASLCNVAGAQSETPAFSITISTPKDVVKAGSEVKLDFTMVVSRNIPFGGASSVEEFFDIEVRDSQGAEATETAYGRKLHGKEPPPKSIDGRGVVGRSGSVFAPGITPPGYKSTGSMTLNKIYDFSKPGKYSIQVRRNDPTTKTVVKSNTITVTVTTQ